MAAGSAIIDGAKHYFSPFSVLSSLGSGIGSLAPGKKETSQTIQQIIATDPHDPLAQRDVGYAFAQGLQGAIHNLAKLLTYEHGPEEWVGVDWEGLSGRGRETMREKGIGFVQAQLKGLDRQFCNASTAITRQVRAAARSAEEVSLIPA